MAYQRSAAPVKTCAAEVKETTVKVAKASDDQYESQNFLFPTGVIGSKVIMSGVLTEKEAIDDTSIRMRLVDSTGSISLYAGQYQPEIVQASRTIEIPSFVSIVGKMSTYDGSEGQTYVSVKPQSITVIDEATRNDFIADIANEMVARITKMTVSPEDQNVKMATTSYSSVSIKGLVEMVETYIGTSIQEPKPPVSSPVPPSVAPPTPPQAPHTKTPETKKAAPMDEKKPDKKQPAKKTKKEVKEEPLKSSSEGKVLTPLDLSNEIFPMLVTYGRLSVTGIVNYLKDKNILTSIPTLEAALNMLMQQGMIIEPTRGYFEAIK